MSKLYEQVAEQLTELVDKGVYNYGEKVPSVRRLSRQFEVSTTTVVEAYRLLEDKGVLEVRAQSGHYVTRRQPDVRTPQVTCPKPENAVDVTVSDLVMKVMKDNLNRDFVRLGGADTASDLLPTKKLQKCIARAAEDESSLAVYDLPPGCFELRLALAKLGVSAGLHYSPDDLILTNGCQEALTLALRAVCDVGDVVAIESPTFYGQLQAIEMLGLKVLEIPSDPVDGMSLDALMLALDQMPVKAVVVTLVHFCLTPGQSHDCPQALRLLEGINAGHVLADRAYDSNAVAEWLIEHEAASEEAQRIWRYIVFKLYRGKMNLLSSTRWALGIHVEITFRYEAVVKIYFVETRCSSFRVIM